MVMSALIKYIVVVVMAFVTTAEKTVKLKITTTSCKSSCSRYYDDACPSSITFDNKEMSYQKDGFNILVIDNYTGKVKKRKHLKWFYDLIFWRKKKFTNFFKSITLNSTVIITFQNMCKKFDQKWYSYLSGLHHNIPKKMNSYQAIVVACKGTCPHSIDEKLPYTYYSSGVRFEKTITLRFPGGRHSLGPRRRSGRYEADIPAIAGGVATSIIMVTLIYACYLYYRQRSSPDDNYYISFPDNFSRRRQDNMTCENINASGEQNEPIYEEIGHSVVPNIYDNANQSVSTDLMKDISEGQSYHVPDTLTGLPHQYEKPPISRDEPGVTTASAPPLALYVSMDHINEPYVTSSTHIEESNNLL